MTVAETIRQERKKVGLSQAELGKRLGVSQSMIAQYECGIRKPKIRTIRLISDALGADMELFLQAIIDEACEVMEKFEKAEAAGDFSEIEKEMGLPPGSLKPLPPEEKERIEKEKKERQRKIDKQIHRISVRLRFLDQRELNQVEDCVNLLLDNIDYSK